MTRYSSAPFDFSPPPLDPEDQRLIVAYETVGRPLDDLPYTEDFETLCDLLQVDKTNMKKHFIYKRLLNLRKRGLLPRIWRSAGSSGV